MIEAARRQGGTVFLTRNTEKVDMGCERAISMVKDAHREAFKSWLSLDKWVKHVNDCLNVSEFYAKHGENEEEELSGKSEEVDEDSSNQIGIEKYSNRLQFVVSSSQIYFTKTFLLLFVYVEEILDSVVENFEIGVDEQIQAASNSNSINNYDGGGEKPTESEKGMNLKNAMMDKFGPINKQRVSRYLLIMHFSCQTVM